MNTLKQNTRVLPVFVNLVTCNIYDKKNILSVLISRTLRALQQSLKAQGIILTGNIFKPITNVTTNPIVIKLEEYINESTASENESDGISIDDDKIKNNVDQLIVFLNDLCSEFTADCRSESLLDKNSTALPIGRAVFRRIII